MYATDELLLISALISIEIITNISGKKYRAQIVKSDALDAYIIGSSGADINDDYGDENKKNQVLSGSDALQARFAPKRHALNHSLLSISLHS